MHNARMPQAGNALFIILVCIVLFAALTYVVSGSMNGSNTALSSSKQEALAVDIISTAAGYEKAVNKLINKGVSETRISFNRSSGDGYELTPTSTDSEKVFSSAGGGANYLPPLPDMLDSAQSSLTYYGQWVFTGIMNLEGMGLDLSDAQSKDLIAILPYVRQDVCIRINNLLNMTNPSGIPPNEGSNMNFAKFTGVFSTGSSYLNRPYNRTSKAGCIEGSAVASPSIPNATGKYFFYYALMVR